MARRATIDLDPDSDVEDGRERWARARQLYEANLYLFEDELDALAALGLVGCIDVTELDSSSHQPSRRRTPVSHLA